MSKAIMIAYGGESLTLGEIARRNGIHPNTLKTRWTRVGRPLTIEPGSELVAPLTNGPASRAARVWIDGECLTVPTAARKLRVSADRIRARVAELGSRLSADQVRRRKKSGKGQAAEKRDRWDRGPMVTLEERRKLARIPGPTKLEYEVWGVNP